MSKQMLTSFFPAHCSVIFEQFLPRLYELAYPSDVEELCPPQVLNNVAGSGITVRRPFVATFALFGILIGMIGAARIKGFLTSARARRLHPETPLLHDPALYWMLSFFFFGLMTSFSICGRAITFGLAAFLGLA